MSCVQDHTWVAADWQIFTVYPLMSDSQALQVEITALLECTARNQNLQPASFLQANNLFMQQTALPFASCCRTNSFSFWTVWQICTTAPRVCQQQSTRRSQMLKLRSMVSAHCILPIASFSIFLHSGCSKMR